MKVKIVSGWTNKGGSTVALCNLTNLLNSKDVDTTFYGPHDWHLNRCKSDMVANLNIEEDDYLITHFVTPSSRPKCKRVLLSCHEKWWFEVADIPQHWDSIVFLHDAHREYHSKYKGDYYLIPNVKEDLERKTKDSLDKVAGIIGAIEDRKQTHISIERALKDGCEKVYLFGEPSDFSYFIKKVKPLVDSKVVFLAGFQNDKQSMYDKIGRVYHSSKGEVACLVKDECFTTGTKFFGNEETENTVSDKTNDEVFAMWMEALNG